ncbi:unnamed protein product [Phytophthora fragariaefolia]|uniref:Unnamed protein product n=1 Tax=Phytophthora fragariaefolia TaxID=1490495 RepID=A0A9W6XI96_9STRA|nr:unnamed protein product [Phytophthora fragariaefolia]
MRSSEKIVDEVPRFVRTLYDILHDEDPCILSWSVDGSHFKVYDVPRLEREILPKYFKHSKFASFQRQLNNFGFRKWTKTRASVCTFSHEFLHECHPSQLAPLVAEMEMQKAVMCAATSHIGAKRFRDDTVDEHTVRADISEVKQDDEHEPEQELGSFSPEHFGDEPWPLAGLDLAELSALDWSLAIDSEREGEHCTLLEPILNQGTPIFQTQFGYHIDHSNNEVAVEALPPLDTEYLGDSWIDIFDEVAL